MTRPRVSVIPLLAALAGCATGLSGRYELQTVNGEILPYDILFSEVTALDLRLDEDGTCSASTRTAGRETPVTENDCTWTSEGATIWLVTDDGENLTGTVANGELTITNEGNVLVFVRR